ncbi:MotA/TolQ/ExbB proton channel family protein [Prevotella sp. A2931]|uniref:MotA/TolQ/ExbB proton channel family protein n=1 Tax=Prevotella illustrans TaxID=2800387 RepID=A0ABS3M5H4_9BACT|nr:MULTISPECIES: MotA/TolQ/ExbB proton channel family protein [Prevotella]MBO1363389.1 MotA/TolQ/ExbB proton channel family protein [Prevotella illustrans]PTL26127.1 flagellar motor protein MotA [Prevotella sp. oral taxon 820]
MATTTVAPKKKSQGFQGVRHAFIIIVLAFIVGWAFYNFFLGDPANFANGDREGHPLNMLGTVYKGGWVVPIILGLLCTVIAMSVERTLAIRACSGTGNVTKFTENVKAALKAGDIAKAEDLCNKQKGSVANVVLADLKSYKEMESTTMGLKEKVSTIQNAHEEATALEMPTMTMNLPIIATIVTLGTLTALFGTVLGMIRSFAALAAGGGADSMALSTGISEALVNTASGIATSWVSVVSYNYFTNKIDKLTFAMDEIGYTIAHTYEDKHPEA